MIKLETLNSKQVKHQKHNRKNFDSKREGGFLSRLEFFWNAIEDIIIYWVFN